MVIRRENNVQSCQQSRVKPKIKLQENLVMPKGTNKKLSIFRKKVVFTRGGHWSAWSHQAKFVEVDTHKIIFLSECSSCFK